jgi:hypothetical protein
VNPPSRNPRPTPCSASSSTSAHPPHLHRRLAPVWAVPEESRSTAPPRVARVVGGLEKRPPCTRGLGTRYRSYPQGKVCTGRDLWRRLVLLREERELATSQRDVDSSSQSSSILRYRTGELGMRSRNDQELGSCGFTSHTTSRRTTAKTWK